MFTLLHKWESEEDNEILAKGRAEEKHDAASRMLAAGRLSLEDIAAYADLPLEDVRALAASRR